jgi:hypothetical protein
MSAMSDLRAVRWNVARQRARAALVGDDAKGAALAALERLCAELVMVVREQA